MNAMNRGEFKSKKRGKRHWTCTTFGVVILLSAFSFTWLLKPARAEEVGEGGPMGPDVTVSWLLSSMTNYGSVGDIAAFSIATISCNVGDTPLNWNRDTVDHPVITQNMYRLKEDRFEHIGLSWIKHGFQAVNQTSSTCGTCTVEEYTSGIWLYPGCSDLYNSGLNGDRSGFGPHSGVNPFTGALDLPVIRPSTNTIISGRLQVHHDDLDPLLNEGAQYFAESQYVAADDAAAGNALNNASYRGIHVSPPDAGDYRYRISPVGNTVPRLPAIHAWAAQDSDVLETVIDVWEEGRFLLAAKAKWVPATGLWRYEYALFNLNSDRACGSLQVLLPADAFVDNIGFHDVDYHSTEIYDGTDWPAVVDLVESNSITWATDAFDDNPAANALRWSTLYNFRFDCSAPPISTSTVTLGLFKPGDPPSVSALSLGPTLDYVDCNHNHIDDACEFDCGEPGGVCDVAGCGLQADCNGNLVPDDCDPDCGDDGIIDDCDDSDADFDTVIDCYDLCPLNTPEGYCACPSVGLCCVSDVDCLAEPVSPTYCVEVIGGEAECDGSQCKQGCPIGDFDFDGDLDLQDYANWQLCYGGADAETGFEMLTETCLFTLDRNEDGAVNISDFRDIPELQTGPL